MRWMLSSSAEVVIAGFAPGKKAGTRDLYVVERVEPGEVPADRLAYWQAQSVKDRGGATELFVATKRTSTVLDTFGWTRPSDLTDPVPERSST